MEFYELAEKARKVKTAGEEFLAQNEKEMIEFLRKDPADGEESLQKEMIFELMDNIYGMCHMAEYMTLPVIKEGVLELDGAGEILMNGEVLPLMTEMEVELYDQDTGMVIWTRTYVAGAKKRYLAGVERCREINGMKVRMRG